MSLTKECILCLQDILEHTEDLMPITIIANRMPGAPTTDEIYNWLDKQGKKWRKIIDVKTEAIPIRKPTVTSK